MKEKWVPKVGDHIAVYCSDGRYTGTIHQLCDKDALLVTGDVARQFARVHKKQCRRLVRKKRREWYLVFDHDQDGCPYAYTKKEDAEKNNGSASGFIVHVKEVRKP